MRDTVKAIAYDALEQAQRAEKALAGATDEDLVAELRKRGRLLEVGAETTVERWQADTPGYAAYVEEVLRSRVGREIMAMECLRRRESGPGQRSEETVSRVRVTVLTVGR